MAGSSARPSLVSAGTTSVMSQNRRHRSLVVGGQVVGNASLYGSASRKNNPPPNAAFAWTGLTVSGWGCGGALIHSDIVLSAAHCQWAFNETMQVYIGPYSIDNHDQIGETVPVRSILPHPDHVGIKNDVLLVQLHHPSTVAPFHYNTDPSIPNAMVDPITIFGFGTTAEGGNLSSVLREVEVYAFNSTSCVNTYPEAVDAIHLCAGTVEGGKDACDSDSGSPLIVGITVVAVTDDGIGCGRPNIPSLNARVSGFADWITQSICDLSQHPPETCNKKVNSIAAQGTAVKTTSANASTMSSKPLQPQVDTSNSVRTRPVYSKAGQVGIPITEVVILSLVCVALILALRFYKNNRKCAHYQEIPSGTLKV
jgi:secreted trypsin-like serine protease